MINLEISRLVNYGVQKSLISNEDKVYTSNLLCEVLGVSSFEEVEVNENLVTATPILEKILEYAVANNICEDTVTDKDLLDTKIMNLLMPRPSEVISKFKELYKDSKEVATNYYFNLSIASNYIRKDRTDKNVLWKAPTEYGDLDITINLSKPEKDPKEIAKAKLVKSSSYPKCLLCKENEGFAGTFTHPARQNHRIIPLSLQGRGYFMQYSPYTYYNEHCIIFNSEHIPMKINKDTFSNLVSFIDVLPHYFAGSNADLPIVGGSILSHDHYQGGRYTFAMETAVEEKSYIIEGYEEVKVSRVKWPMSVVRISSENKDKIVELADHILTNWRGYSDEAVGILSESNGEPHNTITPIARKKNNLYELDLVLRNNRTTEEYPLGIFHPHNEVHHIKKENIGLIEVMGLAVLPARLKEELDLIQKHLLEGTKSIETITELEKHSLWYSHIKAKHSNITKDNVEEIVQNEVGAKFLEVLCHAGVYKRDEEGMNAFDRFIGSL